MIRIDPTANGIPFDNSTNGFVATNTQSAIEEAKAAAGGTNNNGMGARIIPSGQTYTIDTNYESVITRQVQVLGRLVLKGRLSVIF